MSKTPAEDVKQEHLSLLKRRSTEMTFFSILAGVSIIFGFGLAVTMTKRRNSSDFAKGLIKSKDVPESGINFALRALGWGTFYAVGGVGLFSYTTWKLSGATNMTEFTQQMGKILPEVPKNSPQGRNEFESIRELFEYLVEEDEKVKGSTTTRAIDGHSNLESNSKS